MKGVLNLTNLRTFDLSLKLSWLVQYRDLGLAEFPHKHNIHKIILHGDDYTDKISKSVKWSDVAHGACRLQKFQNRNAYQNRITHNSKLSLQFRHDWVNRGYRLIKDILNIEGELMTITELHKKALKNYFGLYNSHVQFWQ